MISRVRRVVLVSALVIVATTLNASIANAVTSESTVYFEPSPNPPAGGFYPECARGLARTTNTQTWKSFTRTQVFYQPNSSCNTTLNRDPGWIGVYLLQFRVVSGGSQLCADSGWQYNSSVTYSFWIGNSLANCGSGNYYTIGIHRYRPAGQGQVTSGYNQTGVVAL